MSGPVLLPVGPEDIEAAVVAWLTPLRRSSIAWETGDGTPFSLVTHLTGGEDPEVGFADHVVQVDTLCDKQLGYPNARHESRLTHQRMLEMARYLGSVTLSGRVFAPDYVKVVESPHLEDFGISTVLRHTSRYLIGHPYVPVSP